MRSPPVPPLPLVLALCVVAPGCWGESRRDTRIVVDGSSTVYPITEGIAEKFRAKGIAEVTIDISGTGGGFEKLCAKQAVITGASRPIRASEVELCSVTSVEFIELPVAYDSIAVVVHPHNTWVDAMTVEELRMLWAPEAEGSIRKWSDLREGWPEEEVHLFGPGVDSGTYDYFTKMIVGEEHASREDFTSSEDDNALVRGVSDDPHALGFFGYAYYAENKDRVKVVPIDDGNDDNGAGPIAPSPRSVSTGSYQPLSRPVFIYVSKAASWRTEVKEFVEFYLSEVQTLAAEVGYTPLTDEEYELTRKRFKDHEVGSAFGRQDVAPEVTVARQLGPD